MVNDHGTIPACLPKRPSRSPASRPPVSPSSKKCCARAVPSPSRASASPSHAWYRRSRLPAKGASWGPTRGGSRFSATSFPLFCHRRRGKHFGSEAASRHAHLDLEPQLGSEAPLTHEVAFESRRLALSTEDPADRFLAATAKVYDLTLVTADERLIALREINVLSNRSR